MNSTALVNDIDSRLAFDLATQMSELPVILERYSLTAGDLQAKLANPVFQKIFRDAKALWSSDLSVKERIRLKSQALIEDSLLEMYRIFHDETVAPPARIEAFKTMAKVATVDGADQKGPEAGTRVNITFNIPNVAPMEVQGNVYEGEADGREEIAHSA